MMEKLFRAWAIALCIATASFGGMALAQSIPNAQGQLQITRAITLKVDPFGGEFSQYVSQLTFSDYTPTYTFRWELKGPQYGSGRYVVRDQNNTVIKTGPVNMAGKNVGFFTLRLRDLPERPQYRVTMEGLVNGQPAGTPSTIVTMTFQELEVVPFNFTGLGITAVLDRHDTPGVTGAVSCSPTHFAEWSAGVRRTDSTVKVQNDDLWHIGSNTKAITVAMIAKLVEEGHFDWDTTVWDLVYEKQLLPKSTSAFPLLFSTIDDHFKGVTVDRLAAHRSGMIMPGSIDSTTRGSSAYFRDPKAFRGSIIAQMLNRPHGGTIGEWRYGHGNFMMLGHLIENVRGKRYEQVIREEIFAPLGMTTANFGMPTDRALTPGGQTFPFSRNPSGDPWRDQYSNALNVDTLEHTNGHLYDVEASGGPRPDIDNRALPPVWNPAGGAYMSSKDYLKFARLIIDGQYGDLSLQPSSIAMIQSAYMRQDRVPTPGPEPVDPSYGWAWGQGWDGGWGQVLSHGGSYFRFVTTARVYVDSGFAAVATVNVEGDINDPDEKPGDNASNDAMRQLIADAKRSCATIVANEKPDLIRRPLRIQRPTADRRRLEGPNLRSSDGREATDERAPITEDVELYDTEVGRN
ncbi:MAG: serine hydrolase domain-containing protein [Pseudomonadota bacterium]